MSGIFSPPPALMVGKILFYLRGADMNSTADQQFVKNGSFSSWIATNIRAANASLSLTTAAGGVYGSASKSGTILVSASQVYSSMTSGAVGINLSLTGAGSDELSVTPYLSLTTPQGAAATLDYFILGYVTA